MRLRPAVTLMLLVGLAGAARAAETARQILDRRKALDDTTRHWDDRHQKMKLTIVDRRGGERVRELELFDRREPGDEQKTILFFLAPAEVKGTGFLAFTHKGRAADQWLYLPELQRVRQITARTRNESFVGTDLSYHDLDLIQELTSWTEDDARSSLRGEETVDGTPTYAIELFDRREPGDEQKTLLFFLAPAEVKGTGFLAFTHKGRPADQWLYLPELQRVRQITARTRNESFMGTDLSYHDLDLIQEMTSWTETDARSSLRGEETVEGTPTYAIEEVPQREDIGYKKIVVWLGHDDLVPRRLELYEDAAEPKKRIAQSDVKSIGAIPVPHHVEVATPAAGSHTVIEIADVQFNQKLDPDLFTQRYLERGGR